MSFTISYEADDCLIVAFYPFNGWDVDDPDSGANSDKGVTRERMIIRDLIKSRNDTGAFRALCDDFRESDDADQYMREVGWFLACSGSLEVVGKNGDVIYSNKDYKFQEDNPEIRQIIPDCIDKEFCIVKVWENRRSGVIYEHPVDGEFDFSLLKYVNGQLYYAGMEFESMGSEGMSSYEEVYVDGLLVH
jgi:hypothetical protein